MKTRTILLIVTCLFASFILVACGAKADEPAAETAVINVEATVNAAVMATATAEAMLEENINTAVDEAVDAAVDEAVDAAVDEAVDEAVAEALANATPEPEYSSYTEEELVVLIEETTQQAAAETVTYTESTTVATSDGTVTAEEAAEIVYYVTVSEETLAEVDAMIETYYALYGGTGDEIVAELVAIESELSDLNDSAAEMVVIMDEINESIANGYALAETTITQLEQTAAEAQTAVNNTAIQMQAWAITAQENFAPPQMELTTILENSMPTEMAGNQEEALAQLVGYINTTGAALADSNISPEEMQAIAQMGSNATASLTAQNVIGAAAMTSSIDQLNQQMVQGDIQGAMAGLSGLQRQLPDLSGLSVPIPGGGGLPGISIPSR